MEIRGEQTYMNRLGRIMYINVTTRQENGNQRQNQGQRVLRPCMHMITHTQIQCGVHHFVPSTPPYIYGLELYLCISLSSLNEGAIYRKRLRLCME